MTDAEKKQNLIYGDGPLEKAMLFFLNNKGKTCFQIPVQFNPNEYSISRGVEYKANNGVGQEASPSDLQPVKGELAQLKLDLVIDVATSLSGAVMPKALDKYLNKHEISELCMQLSLLMKYDHEDHEPNGLKFCWGSLQFTGQLKNLDVKYDMFNREGKPVRASLSMTLEGEEVHILKKIKVNPNESPDRTKYRILNQTDELWMLADKEYDDAYAWKEIARENGILNPRKIDHTRALKIPSIT